MGVHNRVSFPQLGQHCPLFPIFGIHRSIRGYYYSNLFNLFDYQMEASPFLETLLSQSALVVFMGFVAYTLWKKLEDALNKKDSMAEALIKITMLWEERYSKESQDDRENKVVLKEILDIIKSMKNGS